MRTGLNLVGGFVYFALPLAIYSSDAVPGGASSPHVLRSGNATLEVTGTGIRLTLSVGRDQQRFFVVQEPICLDVVGAENDEVWLTGSYSTVVPSGGNLTCTGKVTSPNGTVFSFTDVFTVTDNTGTFLLSREVHVRSAGRGDEGFLSRFSMTNSVPSQMADYEFFVPGIWYVNNRHVAATALAGDLKDESLFFREDRLPLPLVMMRDKRTGGTLSFTHYQPSGKTTFEEYGKPLWIDARFQFASLGVYSQKSPAIAILYPGTEGEMTYRLPGFATTGVILHPGAEPHIVLPKAEKHWAKRFHPVRSDIRHSYKVLLRLSHERSFAEAMQNAWRSSYDHFRPPILAADLQAVYQDSIGLLTTYAEQYNGIPGIPFAVNLNDGTPKFVSFQMGFVGQQTTAAFHLLRHGLATKQPEIIAKGEAIVDFWATQSLTDTGLPRTWYDPFPQPHWIPYNTFLRIASDGAEGILHAWAVMHRYGQHKTHWLRFCERFGNWLVTHQNGDGSFYREYDFSGKPVGQSKFSTTHPIQFLVDLSKATGRHEYLDAALRAGRFCLSHVHEPLAYVGGTPDNPDVMTRESGLIAIDAFLSLYDATMEKTWLDAAKQAATFSETWLYAWNVPVPPQDKAADFPREVSTVGLSIIATGHSGADVYMAAYPFQYYRLYLYTGDEHFAAIARLLLHNTKQMVDRQGSLGYAHSGMLTEALTVAPPRGHSVNIWLPWLTTALLDPLASLEDAFGDMEIDQTEKKPLAERQSMNLRFAQSRGLPTTGQP